jgi:hypothetical protein
MQSVEQSLAGGVAPGASQPSGTLSHYASLVENQKAVELKTSPNDQTQLISQLRATIAQQQATAQLQLQTTAQTQQRLASLKADLEAAETARAAAENAHETCRRTLAETQQKLDDYNATDGFILSGISLTELEKADLDAKLAAEQAKCTALNEEVERLRRMSEAVATDAREAEEAQAATIAELREAVQTEQKRLSAVQIELDGWMHSFETVEFERDGANEMVENGLRLYVNLCEDYALTCKDAADADEHATKKTGDALDCTAELNEARGKLAQQEAQMAEHRKGFTHSTTAMHEQLTATKNANEELQGRIARLTTELDTLRGKLSAAERTNTTLKTSNEELNERLNETVQARESRVAHLVDDSMKVARAEIEALKARLTQSSEEEKRLTDALATALREQSAQVEAQVASAVALAQLQQPHGMQNQGGAASGVGTGTGSETASTAAFCEVLGLPVVMSNGDGLKQPCDVSNQDGEENDAPAPKRSRTCTCGRDDKVERGEPTKTGHRDGCPAKKQRLPPKPTTTTPPAREEALQEHPKFLEALRCVLAHIRTVGVRTLGKDAPDPGNVTLADIRERMLDSNTKQAMWKLCHDPLSTPDTAELFNPFFNPSGWKSPNWDEHCHKPLHCLPQ